METVDSTETPGFLWIIHSILKMEGVLYSEMILISSYNTRRYNGFIQKVPHYLHTEYIELIVPQNQWFSGSFSSHSPPP